MVNLETDRCYCSTVAKKAVTIFTVIPTEVSFAHDPSQTKRRNCPELETYVRL